MQTTFVFNAIQSAEVEGEGGVGEKGAVLVAVPSIVGTIHRYEGHLVVGEWVIGLWIGSVCFLSRWFDL